MRKFLIKLLNKIIVFLRNLVMKLVGQPLPQSPTLMERLAAGRNAFAADSGYPAPDAVLLSQNDYDGLFASSDKADPPKTLNITLILAPWLPDNKMQFFVLYDYKF